MKKHIVLTVIAVAVTIFTVAASTPNTHTIRAVVDNTTLRQRIDLLRPLLGEPKLHLKEIPFGEYNEKFWTRVELEWSTPDGTYKTGTIVRLSLPIIEAQGKDWISKQLFKKNLYYHTSWVTVVKKLK